ncbi:MAG: hypothetical protein ABR599_00565 [Gemmatimonadota bacterium]
MRAWPLRPLVPLVLALLAAGLAGCDQFEDPDLAQIRDLEPDSGAVGSLLTIEADNLLDGTRVIFEDEVESPVAVLTLESVVTIVPEGAETGDIAIETGGERSSSRAPFTVIPAPPSTPVFFDPDVGAQVTSVSGECPGRSRSGDDSFIAVPLPFDFPFYGRAETQAFVSTNGLVTFGEPQPCDNSGTAGSFGNADEIAVLNFDLEPGIGGQILVNSSDPAKAVVTFREVPICGLSETSNTFQLVLFPDGRIRMNYGYVSTQGLSTQCVSSSISGSLVGITPRTATGRRNVSFTGQTPLSVGAQEGVFENFFLSRLFNLENRSLLFTPIVADGVFGGYQVELLTPA